MRTIIIILVILAIIIFWIVYKSSGTIKIKKESGDLHAEEPAEKKEPEKLNDFESIVRNMNKKEIKSDDAAVIDTSGEEYENGTDHKEVNEEPKEQKKDFDLKSAIIHRTIFNKRDY